MKNTSLEIKKTKKVYVSSTSFVPSFVLSNEIIFLIKSGFIDKEDSGKKNVTELWTDKEAFQKVNEYLSDVYISLLDKIGTALSQLHRIDYPATFWEIPLSPWLLHYISVLYDRYTRLKIINEKYYDKDITLLSCRVEVPPAKHYSNFIETTCFDEEKASGFYGDVARVIGLPVSEFEAENGIKSKKFICGEKKKLPNIFKPFLFTRLYWKIREKFLWINSKSNLSESELCISGMNFSVAERIALIDEFKVFYYRDNYKKIDSKSVNREKLLSIHADDTFENLAVQLLPKYTPTYLLEEFRSYLEISKNFSNFKLYITSNELWGDSVLQYACSLAQLGGAKIVGWQHGGGYGQFARSLTEFAERRYSDYYITWGWDDSRYKGAKIFPMPQPGLSSVIDSHKQKLDTILWAGTSVHLFVKRFIEYPFMPDWIPEYFKNKKIFLSALDDVVRGDLLYRPYMYDYGSLEHEKKIFKNYSGVKISCEGSLLKLLQIIKVFVCDHMGTSFLQALVMNTPTVLFWNSRLGIERKEAKPYFDLLRNAGILFDAPEDAAKQVNNIWNDVQGWWGHIDRQSARRKFMDRFCRVDQNCIDEWIKTFKEILRASKKEPEN